MKIELPGKYGGPRLRDGLVVVLFKRGSPVQWASEVLAAFESWLNSTPVEAKSFACVGANSSEDKPANARTLDRCRGMLDAEKVKARKLTSFNVQGPQEANPDFYFKAFLNTKPKVCVQRAAS